MKGYTPSSGGNKEKEYTEKQQYILDNIWRYGGDAVAAAKAAGYSNPYKAVDVLKDELIELAEKAMARLSAKSISAIENVLDSKDGKVMQAAEKLKAAQLVLDRTNPKREIVDMNHDAKQAIFILPDKRPISAPTDDEP